MLSQCYGALKFLIKYLSIFFLFLVAIYVLVTRIALSVLPEYTNQIERFLSEQTGRPVSIGAFSSRWEGLDPVLNVHGLMVSGEEQFYVKNVRFQLAFWSSVLSLSPKFERILIDDAEMTIKQQTDGRWFFVFDEFDFKSLADQADKQKPESQNHDNLMKYLAIFNGTTLNLKNISATIYKQNGAKRNLRLPNLNVNYKDDEIYASGQILESQGQKALLNFSLHGRGLVSGAGLKGTVYVEARSSEFFSELLSIYDWQKVSIQNVEASSRAWLNFEEMNIVSVYGDMQVSEVNWKIAEKSLPPLSNLAFSYLWEAEQEKSQLSLYDFGFEWANLNCDHGDVKVSLNEMDVSVQAEKMKLQCVSRLLLALDLPSEKLNARLFESNPKGYLKNIHFSLLQAATIEEASNAEQSELLNDTDLSTELTSIAQESQVNEPVKASDFSFEALLDHVNINAYEGAPSGKNLSGYIYADNQSGYVSFISENFELGFPDLFIDPWDIAVAEGRVNWSVNDSLVTVYSEGIRLWRTQESLIYGDFILRLNPDDREDYLALSLGMQGIDFTDAVSFVPYHVVDHDLYEWLKTSLVNGTVSRGIYYGYGSIESHAPENSFTSSIYLMSDQGQLKFDPAWPSLEQLDAEIYLQNGQLDIVAERAMIADTPLRTLTAFMPERRPGKSNAIKVNAQSQVKNDRIHYWLSESPISDTTRPIAEQLLIDASANLDLQLSVPVAQAIKDEDQIDIEYRINVKLENAAIDHIESKLSFSEVKGTLKINSDSGLEAKDIKVKLFNKPARFSLKTEHHPTTDTASGQVVNEMFTRMFLNGNVGTEAIFNYFGMQKPGVISGEIAYSADLTLSDQEKQYPMLTITSDLTKLSCSCPQPYQKDVSTPARLDLSLLMKPDQMYLDSRISSDAMPDIKTELLFAGGKPSFGEILIGNAVVKNTQIKGLNIAAKLTKLDLANWLDFLEMINFADDVSNETDMQTANSDFLKQVQLEISELNAYDHLLRDSKIRLFPDDSGQWLADLSGKDIAGRISLATESKPLSLDLSVLNLQAVSKTPQDKMVSGLNNYGYGQVNDPRQLPEIKFKTASLMMSGRPVGAWQFDLSPDDTGVVIRNVKGHYNGTNISGQLNWRYEPDTQRTIATLMIEGRDVESVFQILNLPRLINSERFTVDVAFVWPAAPYDFSLSNLSGKATIDLESGFIRTEDEKTGALRLFGVLNAESIKRRLKLDFSDLYKSGIGYDNFKGVATIDNGLLNLTEPLRIEGPAGKYLVNGRSDLATKALDFDMLVELPFSQNFPLAALVLGAPQVGGLVWVADKLLGEPLSALTTSRYDITGTWEQPRVDLHQAVNASKKDRTQEKGMRDSRQ